MNGRQPEGIVAAEDYEALRTELATRMEAVGGPGGAPIGARVHRPEALWRERRGMPPDLVVYFGDLAWRSNGSLGRARHWTFDNDTGPDDANHAKDGLWITTAPGIAAERRAT